MKVSRKIGDVRLIERMSKAQIQNYWLELKESRFESYFYREMFERVIKMNPNLAMPPKEEVDKIEQDALNIALWEENWDRINSDRVNRGGTDYTLFNDKSMWINNKQNHINLVEWQVAGNEST